MIKLKQFRQSPGFCGPASLKMVFDYYGVRTSEKEIAKMAGSCRDRGTNMQGMIKAAQHFGFHAFSKQRSSISDLKYFVQKGIPVIVDWFFVNEGHYSVVVDIDSKNISLMDPTLRNMRIYVRRRKLPIAAFLKVWFDFSANFIENPSDLIIRAILVVTPFSLEKERIMDYRDILKTISKAAKSRQTLKIYYPKTVKSMEGWREVEPYSLSTDILPEGEHLIYGADRLSPGHIFNAYTVGSNDKNFHSFIIGKIRSARLTGKKFKARNNWKVEF